MSKLKTAVIGVGYLGKFHAEKYHRLENSELIAVVDADLVTAQNIADKFGVKALTDYHELLGTVDAVSIAAPTTLHHRIACDFLTHGSHVLIEKPITVTVDEADELLKLATKNHCIIQVGHLERFNAAMLDINTQLNSPRFIESHRLAPFNSRAIDVDVVLDLMIHDIDIILDLVDSDITNIQVSGTKVLTDSTDIANARIQFNNGCVANITASRVSAKNERMMRIFQNDAYISVDFQNLELKISRKGDNEMQSGIPEIISEHSHFESNDALLLEIEAFLDSIQNGAPVLVTGEAGRRALDTAINISNLLSD